MKHVMDLPLCQKFQLVASWSDDLKDFEWAISFGSQFDCWMGSLEISTLQPDLLVFLIWSVT
jgi:hypothetical protein